MKRSKILTIVAVVLLFALSITACGLLHTCESVCEECGKCTNAECDNKACADKCPGHNDEPGDQPGDEPGDEPGDDPSDEPGDEPGNTEVETTPTLTVDETWEIHAGEEIDLLAFATVEDAEYAEAKVIIEDDGGFDPEKPGVYNIVYLAFNKFENEVRKTLVLTVKEALPTLDVEVKANRLGDNKWPSKIISFKNQAFVTLNESATLSKQSGVFYNASSSEITLTVSNSDYAVVAIITANGVVVEGRDGANNRLVNADNPVRDSSSAALTDINNVANDMVIPAGGYAIVVQNGYAGDGVDNDGRGFLNYNVIYMVGNVVRLQFAGAEEPLTPYVNQPPVISGNGTVVYADLGNAAFDIATAGLSGVKVTDDNGTFTTDDDSAVELSVTDLGGFDINTKGVYTISIKAVDAENNETVVTRKVEVTGDLYEIIVNGNSNKTVSSTVAIDQDLTVLGKNVFVIYTPNYTGGLNWSGGWGEAFIINEYGVVVRIYDGANGKYYDADNLGGVSDATKCTAGGYLTEAFNSRQAGEYMLVAPNGCVTREFLLANRVVGAKVTLPTITFKHTCESVCIQCEKCTDAECTDEACAVKCEGHAHNCSAICEVCQKCGNAECTDEACANKCDCVTVVVGDKAMKVAAGTIAIDEAAPAPGNYNFIVYTYTFKAENATLSWNNSWSQAFILNKNGQVVRIYDGVSPKIFDIDNRAGVSKSNSLADAYASLSEGEVLVLGANGGLNSNAGRTFLTGVRTIGLVATIPGVTFETLPEHACESACAKCGKCTDTTCILPACLAQCACHKCEGTCATCGGCLDAACTEDVCATKCSCHSCESLCAICGGCADTECTEEVCAKKCVCVMTPETGKYFAINGSHFYASSYYYNEDVTNSTCTKRQLTVFDKNYTGTVTNTTINGYGIAFVLDSNGILVKAYSWDGIYVNGEAKKSVDYPTSDGSYAARAWSELEEGETLVLIINGAVSDDVRKGWALPLCSAGLGKQASLTGFTFGVTEE